MKRRTFFKVSSVSMAGLVAGLLSSELKAIPTLIKTKKQKVLLRSSWQTINIGDIAHTPWSSFSF